MVKEHYRWDFIGLSTDEKPTPETSEKVVDGSTYYCSDNSKLYVYCKDNWYEKTVSGGGGGTSNFNDLANRPKYNGTEMSGTTDIPEVKTYSDFTGTDGSQAGTSGLVPAPATTDVGKFLKADGTWDDAAGSSYTAGDGIDITNAVISATNTGKAKVLTSADYNYPSTGTKTAVALWLLDDGLYTFNKNVVVRPNSATTLSSDGGSALVTSITEGSSALKGWYSYEPSLDTVKIGRSYPSSGNAYSETRTLLKNSNIYNALDSTATYNALSAAQGKVLKDLIDSIAIRGAGAPTTSTVGEVGQLYEDGTNGVLYQLKSIDITTTPNTYNWEEVGGGSSVNVVQTTGTSTTDVMSQNAVTGMVYADSTGNQIKIGNGATSSSSSVVVGRSARSLSTTGIAIGMGADAGNAYSGAIALGAYSAPSAAGEMNIGSSMTTYGYNNSAYRLLTGLYDGQSAHDAATKGQLDSIAIQNAGAPTTATVGTVGQLLEDTTNGKLYICTAVVPGTDPDPDTYTWTEVGAGGSGGVITELTSADYNYPTDNPTSIAMWLLDDGMYEVKEYGTSVKVATGTTPSAAGTGLYIVSTSKTYNNLIRKSITFIYNDISAIYATTDTGAIQGTYDLVTNISQTTGTSTTDVMSQNAVTSMVFADPATKQQVRIGNGAGTTDTQGIALGNNAKSYATYGIAIGGGSGTTGAQVSSTGSSGIAIGAESRVQGASGIAIGVGSSAAYQGSIALGRDSAPSAAGEMNIGTSSNTYGYNSSNYRLLTGLYDGQSDHDAATVGQLKMGVLSTTPTGTTVGFPGRLYTYDSGGGTYEVYLCVHDNGDNTYVWKQVSLI